jgi:beta-glucosidase
MIKKVKEYNKPVVTLIVAGRQVLIKDYIDSWDAAVMCYLPGSEGQGIANVLCGNADFKGKLPSPWYGSVDEIGSGKSWLDIGYGLSYSD